MEGLGSRIGDWDSVEVTFYEQVGGSVARRGRSPPRRGGPSGAQASGPVPELLRLARGRWGGTSLGDLQ